MIELRDGSCRALVATDGGELRGWSADGADLIWPGDPAWWERSAPVLFPIVGWARDGMIRVDGTPRPMGVHGFVAARRFAVAEREAAACRLELTDDAETRAVYPFAFSLTVDYRLSRGGLAIEFLVANRGDRPMPYALGFHPGFRWPLAGGTREGHGVAFAGEEAASVPVIAPGGLFSDRRRPVPLQGRHLALDDALFAAEALCFLDARSRSWSFVAPDGARLTMAVEGFPHLALWSKPGAPFLCMEAWTGYGDPVGFDGELKDKPSMRLLASGATDRARVTLAFRRD